MYRFCLIFLFAFLFFHFNVHAQIDLVFEKVSVDMASQEITLTWQYDPRIDSVTVYKCLSNCDVPDSPPTAIDRIKMDATNLQWIDTGASITSRHDYRIGTTVGGFTDPQNNMVLIAGSPTDSCLNSVLLSWNPYINMTDTLNEYKIWYKKDTDITFMLFDSIKGTHLTQINPAYKIQYTNFLDNNTTYRFLIQAVSKNDTIYAFSNIVEYGTQFVNNDSTIITITCVSVINDAYIEIDVMTDTFPESPQKVYLLRDKHSPENAPVYKDLLSFTVIDSMDYDPDNLYVFKDYDVNPKKEFYYYQVVASHKCKVDDKSNILTNIYLDGERAEKYGDSIRFFQIGIPSLDSNEPFELFRVVYNDKFLLTHALTLKNNRYYVDVRDFMDDGVVMRYQVKSESGCYSNTVTIEHEPIIEFPNAFYPESMNITDKTFYPILRFPSEENYLFVIINRWGQEVYRSILPPIYGDYLNMQGRWDGTFQGKDCPPGFYGYKITYTFGEGGGKYSHSGSLMLVR
jgi:hypothetical protein